MSPKIASYLKKQSEYVKRLLKLEGGFDIVSAGEFLMSMRKLGYRSTFNAMAELIDNAIEALSTKITILVKTVGASGKFKRKHVGAIALIDNGAGMEKHMIRAALRWGGTHRYNERSGIGRFGIGLPGAAGSLALKYAVYSKLNNGEWWRVHMDLLDLNKKSHKGGRITVPEVEKRQPPNWVVNYPGFDKSQSGTVIIIDNPDLLTAGYVITQSFVKNTAKHIGITYRNFLLNSQIDVAEYDSTTNKKAAAYPKVTSVKPLDPLFQREECLFWRMDENNYRAEKQAALNIPVKYEGGEAIIKLRFSMFHPLFATGKYGGEIKQRFSVMKQNQSEFIICRSGRQMSLQRTTKYPNENNNNTLVNYDRFWAMELDFPAVLDDEFNVSANKQSASPSDEIWQLLEDYGVPAIRQSMKSTFKELNDKLQRDRDAAKEKADEYGTPTDEIMEKTDMFDSPAEVTQAIRDAIEQDKVKVTNEKIKEGIKPEVAKKEADAEVKGLEYEFLFDNFGDVASFYKPKMKGRKIKVILNTGHAFYKHLYSKADSTVRKSLRLMVGVLAKSEIMSAANENSKDWYLIERRNWSSRLQTALSIQEGLEPPVEKSEKLDKVEDTEVDA